MAQIVQNASFPMIIARGVSKHFGELQALKKVSFEIGKGEIVGFLGQNGAGKTTLMRILTSYIPASSGEVLIGGEEVGENSLAVRRKIGYLPETPPLYPDMSVSEYLAFAARLKEVPAERHSAEVDRVLAECNLKDVRNKTIGTLSKGFRQRVGIAQAIINDPEVLILDEPTSGLDPIQILQVRKLIGSLKQKRTVLLSTHILSEIEQMAHRVLIIKSGEIIADQPLEALLGSASAHMKIFIRFKGDRQAVERAVRNLPNIELTEIDSLDEVHSMELEIATSPDHHNDLSRKIIDEKGRILEIRERRGTLEDVFLKLNLADSSARS